MKIKSLLIIPLLTSILIACNSGTGSSKSSPSSSSNSSVNGASTTNSVGQTSAAAYSCNPKKQYISKSGNIFYIGTDLGLYRGTCDNITLVKNSKSMGLRYSNYQPKSKLSLSISPYQFSKHNKTSKVQANSVIADSSGNKYVTGYTTVGLFGEMQHGAKDYFITKYDNKNKVVWSKQVGCSNCVLNSYSIKVDKSGYSYITGQINIESSPTGVFVAKYDPNGNLIWNNQNRVNSYSTIGYSIDVDSNGNSYVAGSTVGYTTESGMVYRLLHYFIAKYDTNGNLIWSKQSNTTAGDTVAKGVSIASNGKIYLTGYTPYGNVYHSGYVIDGKESTLVIRTDVDETYFLAQYDTNGNLIWIKPYTSTVVSEAKANGIVVDNNGNSYIAGYTQSSLSGNTQQGQNDYFIAKYSESGSINWIKQIGKSGGDTVALQIALDGSGNLALTGYTNVGLSGQTQNGVYDYFIAKYNSAGTLLYSKQLGAAGGTVGGYGIAGDAAGNNFLVGATTVSISSETAQSGQLDEFLAQYDSNGNLIALQQYGVKLENSLGTNIFVDTNGNSYTTGMTNSALSGQTQYGKIDYFIAKYDNMGNLVWHVQYGASGGEYYSAGIVADSQGNSYISGYTNVNSSGQVQGSDNYFIAKYDVNGNLVWQKQANTTGGTSDAAEITIDNSNNLYITGTTTVGLGGQYMTGMWDYFVIKYDTNGNLIWSRQAGVSDQSTQGMGIIADAMGNIFITGLTSGGLSGQKQSGIYDSFIAKYNTSGNLIWTSQLGAANGDTQGNDVTADAYGNSYITGSTTVGLGSYTQAGIVDLFVSKYDMNGKLVWLSQIGKINEKTSGNGITMANSSAIYITGTLSGKGNLSTLDLANPLFYQYNSNGLLTNTTQNSYYAVSDGLKIGTDKDGNAYIVGNIYKEQPGQNYLILNNYIDKFNSTNTMLWNAKGEF